MDPNSPYDIFVRELVAMDGVDGSEIMLLDGEGCPTDQRIMGALARAADHEKALVAHFDAFKFPTSETVQFRALVTPCLPTCPPVICPVQDGAGLLQEIPSMGRRKRRMLNTTESDSADNDLQAYSSRFNRRSRRDLGSDMKNDAIPAEEMLLVRSIHISDRFGADKKRDRKLSDDNSYDNKNGYNSNNNGNRQRSSLGASSSSDYDDVPEHTVERTGSCINLSTVLGAGAVVVAIQIAMLIIGALLFLRRRDGSKKLLPQQAPRPGHQQTIFVKRY